MQYTLSALAVLCVAGLSLADPPKLPPPLTVEPGDPVQFAVPVPEGTELGYQPAWADDPKSKTVFIEVRSSGTSRGFLFLSKTPGVYPVVFWAKGDTTGAVFVVTVAPPAPPKPPTPPKPPGPADPITERLRQSYRDSPGDPAQKAEARKDLAEVYAQAAVLAGRPDIATADALIAQVRTAVASMFASSGVPADILTPVRRVVADELSKAVPVDGEFGPDVRGKVGGLYLTFSKALKEIE